MRGRRIQRQPNRQTKQKEEYVHSKTKHKPFVPTANNVGVKKKGGLETKRILWAKNQNQNQTQNKIEVAENQRE